MFITQISKSSSWSEEKAINPYPLSPERDGVLVGELVGVDVAEMAVSVIVGEMVEVGVIVGAASGFALALIIFTGLRERIALANPPKCFHGTAIALVTAGLLSLAFMGFAGLVKM